MTALLVIGIIFLVLFIILLPSGVLYVEIREKIKLSVGILGFKKELSLEKVDDEEQQDEKEAKEKKKKHKKDGALKKATDKITDGKPNENSFFEAVGLVLDIARAVMPGEKKLLSRLRFTEVKVLMTVVSESADKTAIKFGAVNAGVYSLLGVIDTAFSLKLDRVSITPDYLSDKAQYDIFFKVKLRLLVIVLNGIRMLCSVIWVFAKKLLNKNQQEETNTNTNTNTDKTSDGLSDTTK